jgi:hypothetical protein
MKLKTDGSMRQATSDSFGWAYKLDVVVVGSLPLLHFHFAFLRLERVSQDTNFVF